MVRLAFSDLPLSSKILVRRHFGAVAIEAYLMHLEFCVGKVFDSARGRSRQMGMVSEIRRLAGPEGRRLNQKPYLSAGSRW